MWDWQSLVDWKGMWTTVWSKLLSWQLKRNRDRAQSYFHENESLWIKVRCGMECNKSSSNLGAINHLAECNITKLCIYGWKCYRIQHWLFPGASFEEDWGSNLCFSFKFFHISADSSWHNITFGIHTIYKNIFSIFNLRSQNCYSLNLFITDSFTMVKSVECKEEKWMLDSPRRKKVVVSEWRRSSKWPEWNKWRKSDTLCTTYKGYLVPHTQEIQVMI